MIDAEDHLLCACDHPHRDVDMPSPIYDLPFLSGKAKHDIPSGTGRIRSSDRPAMPSRKST
jgi:uncharacterized protein